MRADAAAAISAAWIGWNALVLHLIASHPHLFGEARTFAGWYGRGLLLLLAASLPAGIAVGALTRRAPRRTSLVFAAVLAGIAALPLLMWVVYGRMAIYAYGSVQVVGGVALVLLFCGGVLLPLLAFAHARLLAQGWRPFACAIAIALLVGAAFATGVRDGESAAHEGSLASMESLGGGAPATVRRTTPAGPAFRPNVVLLTMDALRADHLSTYGYERPTSPAIDHVAETATLFERAYAARPKTSTSFATLMTGMRPARHGLRLTPALLDDRFVTLAEELSAAGYATYAAVENGPLSPAFHFDQGFQRYEYFPTDSRAATSRAIEWIESPPAEPFFLWRHIVDPHAPYLPPEPHASAFRPPADDHSPIVHFHERGSALGAARPLDGHPRGRTVADFVARYDAEIHFADEQIGAILDALSRRGLRQRSIVIIASDHGESLGEHDYYFEHGVLAYDGAARIPLVISVPQGLGLGPLLPRVKATVENVDLYPTVLELCGLPSGERLDGTSLLPVMRGEDRGAGSAIFEAGDGDHMGPGWLDALVEGHWKYIRRRTAWMLRMSTPIDFLDLWNGLAEGGLERDELYDLAEDPGELHDRIAEKTEIAAAMRARLETRLAALPPAPASVLDTPPAPELDAGTRDALERLGYGTR